jgi:drug/metabolite transporter (DMT)-like permease
MMGCFGQSNQESQSLLLKDKSGEELVNNINQRNLNDKIDENGDLAAKEIDENIDKKNLLFAYGMCLIAVILMTTGLACTQALDQSIPHSELNGLRFVFQYAITSPFLIGYKKCDVRVDRKCIGWVLLGAVFLTIASYGQYGAVYYIPLGVSTGIQFSFVLILNGVISSFANKVFRWYYIASAILCICGVLMVIQPEFLFSDYAEQSKNLVHSRCHVATSHKPNNSTWWSASEYEEQSSGNPDQVLGYILSLSGGLSMALYLQVVNRKLANLNIFVYSSWASMFGAVSSFCIMAFTETPFFPSISMCIFWFLLHSTSAGLCNIVVYTASQVLDSFIVSLIITLHIPLTFIIQYTLFANLHPGHANAVAISGAILVFAGNVITPLFQLLQTKYTENQTLKSKVDTDTLMTTD